MVNKNCPACNSSKNEQIFLKLNFKFVICKKCQTVYVNPSPTEKALEKYYTSSKSMKFWDTIFKETESIRKKKIFQPRVKLISQILKNYNLRNCKTMVEVGAGYGWFCDLAKQKNLAKSIIAIEPSPDLAESCRKIKGIKVIESTIEKNTEKLDSDLIVAFELVHLLYNPKSFLKSCYNRLKKGGVLIFSLTNFHGFDIQILKENSEYVTPTFLTLFNPFSIKLLLNSVGFRNVQIITPGILDVYNVINTTMKEKPQTKKDPFIEMLIRKNDPQFLNDFQKLLQEHLMSSHMVVSAQK